MSSFNQNRSDAQAYRERAQQGSALWGADDAGDDTDETPRERMLRERREAQCAENEKAAQKTAWERQQMERIQALGGAEVRGWSRARGCCFATAGH